MKIIQTKKQKEKISLNKTSVSKSVNKGLAYGLIENKLKEIFKKHIGKENSISLDDVYNLIYGKYSNHNFYEKSFKRKLIAGVLGRMRSRGYFYVVHRGHNYFVLQTQDELNEWEQYKQRKIEREKLQIENAKIWIRKKMYENL